MGPADAAEVVAVLDRVHAVTRASGPDLLGREDLAPAAGGAGRLPLPGRRRLRGLPLEGGDIEVSNLVAGSEATARALWSMVGSSVSIAESVHAVVAPDDPVFWLIGDRPRDEVGQTRWMFRVVDLAAAVAGRGFPAGVTLDAVVRVDDPQRPANSGPWHLSVSGGSGTAEPAGDPAGVRPRPSPPEAFSALFAGVPAATLRRSGLLAGPADGDDALDAAFQARPHMLDYF